MNAVPSSLGEGSTFQSYFRLRLLGFPTVTWKNSIITIPRRSARALLYRLACDPDAVKRDHLLLLFWPEVPNSVARRNLSHLLTHLRRALPDPDLLKTTSDEAWMESSQVWCDALELRNAQLKTGMDNTILERLVSLYQGPFMDGFDLPGCPEYEHWSTLERSFLEHQYLRVLERLVEQSTSCGEISQAIDYAQRYLAVDPLSEVIHQRLIQLYAGIGDRHLAIQQYERCSSILESNLGVAPLPETNAVYQSILRESARFPESVLPVQSTELPGKKIPIFGREGELHQLERIFQRLHSLQGKVVFISGEAGIGKSRLIQDFANIHQEEALILYGCGQAGEQIIPYQPLMNILRSILGLYEIRSPLDQRRISPGLSAPDFIDLNWLAEISRLLPELQAVYPDLPQPSGLEPESARSRLFDSICNLVLTSALAHGPILLCLDDLQWMDASTKAWLIHIGRFIARGNYPIMILGAYRSDEAGEVLELRHSLARLGVLEELQLSGISEAALLELQRFLLGQQPGDEMIASQFHQATGGNPFYLIEIILKLIEDGCVQDIFNGTARYSLPESVRQAVQIRLQRLSSVARQVLEAAAILGQSFEFELLRLTAGRSHAETMAALDELTAKILLLEACQGFEFIHDITRQHVEDSLSQVREELLHRRAGRAYQHLMPDASAVLAYHFEMGAEHTKALHYHAQAAQKAQVMFAWGMVEFHLGHMLDLLNRIDPACEQPEYLHTRGTILAERASSRYIQDKLVERDADLEALEMLGENVGDDQIRLQAIFNRLRYLNLDGDYPQAIHVAERGLSLLDSSPELQVDSHQLRRDRSRLLAQIGFAYYFLGRPLDALALLDEAWNLCTGMADLDAFGRIQHIQGYVHFHLANFEKALECQKKAHEYHAKGVNHNRMVWDLMDIGAMYCYCGDADNARQSLEQGLELCARLGSQRAEAYGLTHYGALDLHRGEYASALDHYDLAVSMQQTANCRYIMATAESGMGLSLYHMGDYAHSRQWLERALQLAQATGLRRWEAGTLIQLGLLDLAEQRMPLARQHLEEGLAIARDCRSGEYSAAGSALVARMHRLQGDFTCSLHHAEEALEAAHRFGLSGLEMLSELELGLGHLELGESQSALLHTRRAVDLIPRASQEWIGHEEAYLGFASALRAVKQEQGACLQEGYAMQALQAKANLISNPHRRSMFVQVRTKQVDPFSLHAGLGASL